MTLELKIKIKRMNVMNKTYCTTSIIKQKKILLIFAMGLFGICNVAVAKNWFEDVSSVAGIERESQTFGISWGDLNGDGWPDAYVSNHWKKPSLYLNQRNGTFLDVATEHELHMGNTDVHGALWADFDNDGDQDLLTAPGATSGILPFFENVNHSLKIMDPSQTGLNWIHSDRMPLWFDQNSDGLLDVLITSIGKTESSAFFHQVSKKRFSNVSSEIGFNGINGSGARLINGELTKVPNVLLDNGRAFQTSTNPWYEITNEIFTKQRGANDYLYGDVDGDGCMDLYAVKLGILNQFKQSSDSRNIDLSTRSFINELSGLDFEGGDSLSFMTGLSLGPKSIRLGANSEVIEGSGFDTPIVIESNDPRVVGEPNFQLEDRALFFIWRDEGAQKWHIRFGSSTRRRTIDFSMESLTPVANLQQINLDLQYKPHQNKFKKGDCAGNYIEVLSDLNVSSPSISGVLADLDNDMDLDLYLTNKNPLDNPPNQLFENIGDGEFREIVNAGGATGSEFGNGGYVSTADYDLDGFLDLFVLNGKTDFAAGGEYRGPHQLFKNIGNSNNWIQIDLEGTYSNRDAIGAFVELYAGGKRQIRYQDGGAHTFSQNYKRMHFGLGINEKVDKIIVTWPSGKTSLIKNIRGNQVIRVREKEQKFQQGIPNDYLASIPGIYLWKETYDGQYKFRIVRQSGDAAIKLELLSQDVVKVEGVSLEPSDQLFSRQYAFNLISTSDIGEDGVDIILRPGAQTLVSLTIDGEETLYNLELGKGAYSPLPEGWILDLDNLDIRPDFNKSLEIGTFVGKDTVSNTIQYRWSGASKLHMNNINFLASGPLELVEGVSLDSNDILKLGTNWVEVESAVLRGYDGINISVGNRSKIGFSVLQDGLFTPEKINRGYPNMIKPNAFWLPTPSIIGEEPTYDPWSEEGMFVWQDYNNIWHLKISADGGFKKYKGRVVADKPIEFIDTENVESHDSIVQIDAFTIEFDMQVAKGWYDEVKIKLVEPGGLVIHDKVNFGTGRDFNVFVGEQKWSVENLPVTLSEKRVKPKWYGPQ